jgi:hypothetical protein
LTGTVLKRSGALAAVGIGLLLLLGGCASTRPAITAKQHEPLQRAAAEWPEERLLDVWIEVFDPGEIVPAGQGGGWEFPQIRTAEAHFMPVHLRDTLEKTGYWGAVRVVPKGVEGAEILLRGTLLQSDGEYLRLHVTASDVSGRLWFSSVYEAHAPYDPGQGSSRRYYRQDRFQSVYHAIANDLARYRARFGARDTRRLRQLAQLRFAADLSPEAFSRYLGKDALGHYQVLRLPAATDPMQIRIAAIRERDLLLVDTLNGHYDNYYREMETPYREWHKALATERAALREAEDNANGRKLLGAAAIVGALALEAFGGNSVRASTSSLRSLMLVGGTYALKTGFDMDSETLIHKDAIEELGESFSAEVAPLVVNVQGEVHELSGSAENQFRQWRRLLRQIHAVENGIGESAGEAMP